MFLRKFAFYNINRLLLFLCIVNKYNKFTVVTLLGYQPTVNAIVYRQLIIFHVSMIGDKNIFVKDLHKDILCAIIYA